MIELLVKAVVSPFQIKRHRSPSGGFGFIRECKVGREERSELLGEDGRLEVQTGHPQHRRPRRPGRPRATVSLVPFFRHCSISVTQTIEGTDRLNVFVLSLTTSRNDEARQPLSRKVSIASSKVNPYRMVIVLRLVVLDFFPRYRILHPVPDAIGLWLTSIICEIWFAVSWILDQFPRWFPIDRETYLDRLSLRSRHHPSRHS
jgi:hypothetical protein